MTDLLNLGPHLLGRNRHPGDERDYPLAVYLADPAATPIEAAAAAVAKSHAAVSVKNWVALATPILAGIAPAPTPVPTPAPTPTPGPTPAPDTAVQWADNEPVLDQGDTGHCVGFGGAQWGNTLPIDDRLADADGHALYYACKVADGEPKAEDGSTVHSLAKVLQQRGRLKTYAWAADAREVAAWVLGTGPVIFGTDWENDMFNPDAAGIIHPTGGIAGGHCYACVGYSPAFELFQFLNSWGPGWSIGGRFYMHSEDVQTLLGRPGSEAMAAVELTA